MSEKRLKECMTADAYARFNIAMETNRKLSDVMKDKELVSCFYCKYFIPKKYPYSNRSIGECYRFPKHEYIDTISNFCGEFKRRSK